ncbi:MAG: ATP-binding protein [Duncaniella sp.]|nr:ATP-binding protein [Muribaculum sp.]MCM1256101.1 ATP-binding protein [Duncaniella sp.]
MRLSISALIHTLLFLIIVSVPAIGSETQWRHLSTEDGLYSNDILNVTMDEEGIIWIATRYGLSMFNGSRVTTLLPLSGHTKPKLYNNVLSVVPGNNGKIYFITNIALGYYDKQIGKFKAVENLESNSFKEIYLTRSGELLVACDNRMVSYNPKTAELTTILDDKDGSLGLATTNSIFQDKVGQIWIGVNGGLLRYSPHDANVYRCNVPDGLSAVKCIYQDSHDWILIGTYSSGIYRVISPYSTSECRLERLVPDKITNEFRVLAFGETADPDELLLATNMGLFSCDLNNLNDISKIDNFEDNHIANIWTNDGIIWISTSEDGIYFCDTTQELTIGNTSRPSLPSDFGAALTVYEDKNGTLWTSSTTYPLMSNEANSDKWIDHRNSSISPLSSIPSTFSITEDMKGNYYLGSNAGGLRIYSPVNNTLRILKSHNSKAVPNNHVMRLFTDSKGNVWIGTMSGVGVVTHDGRELTITNIGDVMGFCEKDGKIYVATLNDGIFYLAIDNLIREEISADSFRLTLPDGFQPVILAIASSKNYPGIYIGTEDEGLWIYNPENGSFNIIDHVTNYGFGLISLINEDSNGTIWVATNHGLFRINPDNTNERSVFTTRNGLKSDYFFYNGMASDSTLVLPTRFGFEIIDISNLQTDSTDMKNDSMFGFTDIHFNNQSYSELPLNDRLSISGDTIPIYSSEIKISNRLNNFSIEFADFNYKNSENASFVYKLDGYDKEWQHTLPGHNYATYTRMTPGRYTFRLRIDNGDSSIRGEEKTLNLVILPPWYLSTFAKIIYALLILAALGLMLLWVRRREHRKNELWAIEQEKKNLEELNRTKLRFFTNVTHELLTPLTVISASIAELRSKESDTEQLTHVAEINVAKLVRLLRQILEFRKAENDNLKLRVSYGDIGTFIENTIEALRPITIKKSMTLLLQLPHQRVMGYFDSDKLDKILYNLISNAAKYSDVDGTIYVEGSLTDDRSHFVIKVSDTGKGIPAAKLTTLFSRFYDGDYREHNTTGTGIGLSLTRDLVNLSHGTISVDSEEGKGTCFTVTLPINESFFNPDEIIINQEQPSENEETNSNFIEDSVNVDSSEISAQSEQERHRILIIEDNEDLLFVMKQILSSKYIVETSISGNEGLQKALENPPAAVITDLTLPDIDGLEIVKRLRNDKRTSALPIIVLTARRQNEDRTESYSAGADVYLPKPFDPAALTACIATQIATRKQVKKAEDGQLVIDLKKLDYQPSDVKFLKLAADVVERNLDKTEFDIPTFAQEVGLSQTHLFRKLKELTDMSPTHFIRSTRLHAAKRMLDQHNDIRINELAYMVGFSDSRYFGISFKKEFGVTPLEYKNNIRNKNQSED